MANEVQKAKPPQGGTAVPVKPDRTADVERLAVMLFTQLLPGNRNARTVQHIAQDAIETARAFFAAMDAAITPDRVPPG